MDQRQWFKQQMNECVDSTRSISELDCERLEPSMRKLGISEAALSKQCGSLSISNNSKMATSCKLPEKMLSKGDDGYSPVKSADFSFLSPDMITLRSQKQETSSRHRGVRKREASMMEYEDNLLEADFDPSSPARKHPRIFPRRHSIVIHRNDAEILRRELLTTISLDKENDCATSSSSSMNPTFYCEHEHLSMLTLG